MLVQPQVLNAFLQSQSDISHYVGFVHAGMSCFHDVKQHWICNAIPDFESICLPELRDPERVEIMNAVYIRAIGSSCDKNIRICAFHQEVRVLDAGKRRGHIVFELRPKVIFTTLKFKSRYLLNRGIAPTFVDVFNYFVHPFAIRGC